MKNIIEYVGILKRAVIEMQGSQPGFTWLIEHLTELEGLLERYELSQVWMPDNSEVSDGEGG